MITQGKLANTKIIINGFYNKQLNIYKYQMKERQAINAIQGQRNPPFGVLSTQFHCRKGVPSNALASSAGWPTILLNSDTVYLEIASDSTG